MPRQPDALAEVFSSPGAFGAVSEAYPQVPSEDYRIQRGRIKFSVYGWCFAPMPMEQLIRASHRMGVTGMDVEKENYPLLRELGMQVTMTGGHGFTTGPFSRKNHPFCTEKLREAIGMAVQWGCSKVITFTGMREGHQR